MTFYNPSNLELITENIAKLKKNFTAAINKYENLKKTCKIDEYFPSKEHAIYKFFVTKLEKFENYKEKLSNIRSITNNEFIDIVFIGRCSVGKSKVINAILMENILPCAPSATTHCFVEISKSDDDNNYLSLNKNEKKYFEFDNLISEIKNKTSSRGDSCCEFNETVHVFLSQSNWQTKLTNGKHCKKIRIIDTPGYDNGNDSSIEKSIIDRSKIANIIVLVVTYNVTDKERKILMGLGEISSKLSIIVLVNKWDLSNIDSDETNASESKIIDSFSEKSIKIYLNPKIFFVSAAEQMKRISAQNKEIEQIDRLYSENETIDLMQISPKPQNAFHNFILQLIEDISGQNFTKYYDDISNIEEFYNKTVREYNDYIQNLSNNIQYFKNESNKMKEELKNFKDKFEKKISKIQRENINFDIEDFFNKLEQICDSKESDLHDNLQTLYDTFINENYSEVEQRRNKFITKEDQEKYENTFKGFLKSIRVDKESHDDTPRNDTIIIKLNEAFNAKLSNLTKKIDNIFNYFCDFECFKLFD